MKLAADLWVACLLGLQLNSGVMPHQASKSGGYVESSRTRRVVVFFDLALGLACASSALITFSLYGVHGLPAHVFGIPWSASFLGGAVMFFSAAELARRTVRAWIAAQIVAPVVLLLALTSVAVT